MNTCFLKAAPKVAESLNEILDKARKEYNCNISIKINEASRSYVTVVSAGYDKLAIGKKIMFNIVSQVYGMDCVAFRQLTSPLGIVSAICFPRKDKYYSIVLILPWFYNTSVVSSGYTTNFLLEALIASDSFQSMASLVYVCYTAGVDKVPPYFKPRLKNFVESGCFIGVTDIESTTKSYCFRMSHDSIVDYLSYLVYDNPYVAPGKEIINIKDLHMKIKPESESLDKNFIDWFWSQAPMDAQLYIQKEMKDIAYRSYKDHIKSKGET